jgi:multicomponent Na+:H+ antiporter subunit B
MNSERIGVESQTKQVASGHIPGTSEHDSNVSAASPIAPSSVILGTGTRYLMPMLILFAGLVTAAALVLYAMAAGEGQARRLLRIEPVYLIATGLALAIASGLPALLLVQPFLTGFWHDASIPLLGKFGTPFVFDVGVYLVVTGIIVKILFTLLQLDNDEAEGTD